MPRGRFLDRDLSVNRRYWSMNPDYRNFWDLLILWLDAEGRMDGDAKIVKGMVCPLSDWTADEIEQMLKKFESLKRNNGLGWIERYHAKGKYCLWASGFEEHQKGLQKDHEAKGKYGYSNIPPPSKSLLKIAEQGEVRPKAKPKAISPLDIVVDPRLAEAVRIYRETFGRDVTPPIYERLKDIVDNYSDDEYQRATNEAKSHNARSPIKYIEACLENWKREAENGTHRGHTETTDSELRRATDKSQPLA